MNHFRPAIPRIAHRPNFIRSLPRWVASCLYLNLVLSVGFCQFQDLSTTDDGSRLYFSSTLRSHGSGQYLHPKIFVLDQDGIHLVAQVQKEIVSQDLPFILTSYYSLTLPEPSGDGSVVAFTGERDCNCPGSAHATFDMTLGRYNGTILTPEHNNTVFGSVKLSRNGRYALVIPRDSWRPFVLVDLLTGETLSPPFARGTAYTNIAGAGRRVIASDGTYVFCSGESITVVQGGALQTFPASQGTSSATIDDDATAVFYESEQHSIVLLDLASGSRTVLVQNGTAPCLSKDGQLLLFLGDDSRGDAQAWIIGRDGTRLRQLTAEDSGIREAVLSGDGRIAYALSGSMHLLRVYVASGEVHDLTPLAFLVPASIYATPGTLVRIPIAGLTEERVSAEPPLPSEMEGIRVSAGGSDAPILSIGPRAMFFQIPWEADPFGDVVPELALEGERDPNMTFFEGSAALFGSPSYWLLDPDNPRSPPLAVHTSFDSFVRPDNPARPGEIIHLYMGGLGPVTPAVASGSASPASPPAVVELVRCWLQNVAAQVLFAGLAAGTVGVYQVSLTLPNEVGDTPRGVAILKCGVDPFYPQIEIPFQPK